MSQNLLVPEVFIVGFGMVVLLHGLGLYTLLKVKINLLNQKILVTSLALVEFVLSLHQVVSHAVKLCGHWSVTWEYIDTLNKWFSYFIIKVIVLHIILDRFAEIYLNVKYPLYMNEKRTKVIVISVWAVSAISAGTITILSVYHYVHDDQIKLIGATFLTILDFLILITAISTYTYFFLKVRSIKQEESKANRLSTHQTNALLWEKFRVPTFMVVTYLLFNITGTILSIIGSFAVPDEDTVTIIYTIAFLLDVPAFLADACIYLFLQKEVRQRLLMQVKRSNRVQSIESNRVPPNVSQPK